MKIIKQIITAKSRKLKARWTMEALDDFKDLSPLPEPKITNSIIEAIIYELYRRYKEKRKPLSIEEEFTQVLAAEITEEIDKEILKELQKTMQVPKDIL